MSGRVRRISSHQRCELDSGWELASCAPGALSSPADAGFASLQWLESEASGTAAAMLRTAGLWSLEGPERRFDAEDWWFRVRFPRPAVRGPNESLILGFDGLATVVEGWLNGKPLLSSDNMFVSHEIAAESLLKPENEIILLCRSLDALLEAKRPRPRWRAPMVSNQRLSWFRTTLLGRTPGWSPPAAPVGPWRPVWLESRRDIQAGRPSIRTQVSGTAAILDVECEIRGIGDARVAAVVLVVSRNGNDYWVAMTPGPSGDLFSGRLALNPVVLWWPHTHGEPALYDARIDVRLETVGSEPIRIDLGPIGFRSLQVDQQDGNFALLLNDQPIFCRGACWTPLDCATLHADSASIEAALDQLVAAGMNMIRVGGTMVYESDAFLDACDSKGVLLWQDFMFANMDYPEGDAAFASSVTLEARQLLPRLAGRPSVAILCGNSECEQQAAMWGAPRERWSQPLFHKLLPDLCQSMLPQLPYWPSSAHGGEFPHQIDVGTVSYYGVGAYLRPVTDARRAEPKFATECLAFANVPEEAPDAAAGSYPRVHSPQAKARVPRDLGAGWDFDDVRDHYLREVFQVDPLVLRYSQHERYLALSRIVSGEVMSAAFREWRRRRSGCHGALIWFLRDLWFGSGWGVIDALGRPKAAYFFLKRLLQPRALFLTDEGGSGVFAHVVNETSEPLKATLEVVLFRDGQFSIGTRRRELLVPPRETVETSVTSLFEGFIDTSYAYRFGPPPCDVVYAALLDERGALLSRDFHFPTGLNARVEPDIGLTARVRPGDGNAEVVLRSSRTAQFIQLDVPGFVAEDQYFHLAPGIEHRVRLRGTQAATALKGEARASNALATCRLLLAE